MTFPLAACAPERIAAVTTVAPGKVHWCRSFEEAVTKAREETKPVLHFQLLGRLDQELC
jgi:hypothetical protein